MIGSHLRNKSERINPSEFKAFLKVMDVINSCETVYQLYAAFRMIGLFTHLYPESSYHSLLLKTELEKSKKLSHERI